LGIRLAGTGRCGQSLHPDCLNRSPARLLAPRPASRRSRRRADQHALRTREDSESVERQGAAAERRAEQAETRERDALDRADRAEQQARAERAELERELAGQRDARQVSLSRGVRRRRWMPSGGGCASGLSRISRPRRSGSGRPRRLVMPRLRP
jgi:hypothetical protein